MYRLSPHEREEVQRQVTELLELGLFNLAALPLELLFYLLANLTGVYACVLTTVL